MSNFNPFIEYTFYSMTNKVAVYGTTANISWDNDETIPSQMEDDFIKLLGILGKNMEFGDNAGDIILNVKIVTDNAVQTSEYRVIVEYVIGSSISTELIVKRIRHLFDEINKKV